MLIPLRDLSQQVFWAAVPTESSDFAAEDPLALDYLAQQVGLWLLPGLTTRTTRAQNYAMVLYGLHLADSRAKQVGVEGAGEEARRESFERWERFWALATMEYRHRQLARSDPDAMRGVRGAQEAWVHGTGPLPLQFRLISRQHELGSLGAYLSSLRHYSLVRAGTLQPNPLTSEDIVVAFWDEPGNPLIGSMERYALQALEPDRHKIERTYGNNLTLRTVGRYSRLSSLIRRSRTLQQDRLWDALFVKAPDRFTLPLSQIIAQADSQGVTETRQIIDGALAGIWGPISQELHERLKLAEAFGRAFRRLLNLFNELYAGVAQQGGIADYHRAITAALPDHQLAQVHRICNKLQAAPQTSRFSQLEFHGRPFLRLVSTLSAATAADSVDALLEYHRQVQVERRRSRGWLCREQQDLVIKFSAYGGAEKKAGFPSLKFDVVRSLLRDLGRLTGSVV